MLHDFFTKKLKFTSYAISVKILFRVLCFHFLLRGYISLLIVSHLYHVIKMGCVWFKEETDSKSNREVGWKINTSTY